MSRGHEQYEENVGAYLLGALPELETEVFEKHLGSCATCRREQQQAEKESALLCARALLHLDP